MRKIISTFLLMGMFALMPLLPTPTMAAASNTSPISGESTAIRPCPAGTFRVRRNTRRNKKLVNTLIATGIGAALGGGIGGGRGALIGAGSGAGGYLVYQYVRDRRGRCVPRYIRRG